MATKTRNLLLGSLWAVLILSLLSVAYLLGTVAVRTDGFQFDGRTISFGNDVIRFTYYIGAIGTVSALMLWKIAGRKKFVAPVVVLFVVIFSGFIFLNQTERVCELKKVECTPLFSDDPPM